MFTPAQYTVLNTELQTDPVSLGYASYIAKQDYVSVANLLATTNAAWTCTQPQISLVLLLQWYASGPGQKIYDYASNTSNNAALRSICLAADKVFSGCFTSFDYSNAANQQLVDALVTGGVLDADDQSSLAALQTLSDVTRTQTVLNLPDAIATDQDVRYALST